MLLQFKLDASENYTWMMLEMTTILQMIICINGDGKEQAITNPVVTDRIQAPAVDYSLKILAQLRTMQQVNSLWELFYLNHHSH